MKTRGSLIACGILATLLTAAGLPACGPGIAQQDAQQEAQEPEAATTPCRRNCESAYMTCLESGTCTDGAGQKVPCEADCRGKQGECEQGCPAE
jgi:hypothetical protein